MAGFFMFLPFAGAGGSRGPQQCACRLEYAPMQVNISVCDLSQSTVVDVHVGVEPVRVPACLNLM